MGLYSKRAAVGDDHGSALFSFDEKTHDAADFDGGSTSSYCKVRSCNRDAAAHRAELSVKKPDSGDVAGFDVG